MHVVSVNTGAVRPLRIGSRNVPSGIGKTAVIGPVPVMPLGLLGDEQADLSVHGGLEKAVYAYPLEHYALWNGQRSKLGASLFNDPLPMGFLGENLTIEGLLETDVWIGDLLHFPGCSLRVTAPREPCFKFNAVMGLRDAGRIMMNELCPGFYLSVAQPGSIQTGEHFTLQPGTRGLRVSEAFATKRLKHLR